MVLGSFENSPHFLQLSKTTGKRVYSDRLSLLSLDAPVKSGIFYRRARAGGQAVRSNNIDINDRTLPFGLGTWWVDERGNAHPAGAIDSSFDNLFLRHLGQVKLNVSTGHTDIMWDACKVEDESLASVLDRLSLCRANISCKLNFFYFGWVSENYKRRQDAVDRVLQIQKNRNVAILHPTLIDNRGLSDIENASDIIRHGYDLWKRAAGRFNHIPQDKLSKYLPYTSIYHHNQLVIWNRKTLHNLLFA